MLFPGSFKLTCCNNAIGSSVTNRSRTINDVSTITSGSHSIPDPRFGSNVIRA